ncbi:MAG: ATP-binding protein [Chlorobi bacterium]|nr:ATP-binding protein [Chlorobiota bacterium]
MIQRILLNKLKDKFFSGKVIILLGARQTGKSTLMRYLQKQSENKKSIFLDCDDPQTRSILQNQSTPNLLQLINDNKIVFIDEAQRVENIGLTLKQIHDNKPQCQIVVSGSSAFELANKINEPLTGRKWEYHLFPLSFTEMENHTSWFDEKRLLETRLIFGSYPDVINNQGNEIQILRSLSNSYLYKDIFVFQDVRKPQIIEKLLQLLAFQIASEVSYNELAKSLQINIATVEKYIDLLEKTFVIFRLPSFSRNLRNELKKSRKIYFYDNGIRNSIISNFISLDLRADVGQLWENYLVSERFKKISYQNMFCNRYFWRTTQQQEIDYIEEHSGKLFAYEFKWNENKKARISKTFKVAYPENEFQIINKENYTDFIR